MVTVAVALMGSLAACAQAGTHGVQQARECVPQVRLDGTTYTGAGYTDIRGTQFSTADQARCEDVGPSPRGSVFSDRPRQVAVWSLPGYSTNEVVAVRFDQGSFSIFVAESMPSGEVNRIVDELSDP